MWYGEFSHSLDEKSRFILPAKFRDKIKNLADKRFYLTRGLDQCLFFLHEPEWRKMEEKLKNVSFTKQDSRFFNRLFFSGAQEIEIDAQGRIIIPDYLKDFSGIKKDIVILGVSDRIEIWDKESWKKSYQENSKKFEDISESLFE
jgi:MraZ protein